MQLNGFTVMHCAITDSSTLEALQAERCKHMPDFKALRRRGKVTTEFGPLPAVSPPFTCLFAFLDFLQTWEDDTYSRFAAVSQLNISCHAAENLSPQPRSDSTKQIRKRCVRPLAASNERPESNERCLCQWLARIVCRRWYEDEIFTFASFHLWEASNPVVPVGHQCQRGNTPLNRSTFTVVATLYNRLFTDYISNHQNNRRTTNRAIKCINLNSLSPCCEATRRTRYLSKRSITTPIKLM